MLIQLHDLRNNLERRLDFCEDVDVSEVHPNVEEKASVHVKAHAKYEEGHYVIDGQLNTAVTLKCSKCLTAYDWPLRVPWHEVFTQYAEEDDDESGDVHLVEGNDVDLTPYIRETLLLSIPFVPVCDDNCRGLCPTCGANRNEERCHCTNERIDPRLADLQKFFSENDSS